jgi:hypothetical protein
MTDAPSSPSSSSSSLSNGGPWQRDWQPQGVTCVDGVTKMSVLKGESNIENGVIRVSFGQQALWCRSSRSLVLVLEEWLQGSYGGS